MMVFLGGLLGGLFLILKELLPLLTAMGSGVIHTRGHSRKKVERAVDPDRFKALCRQRFNGMGLGLLVIGFGVLWALLGLFALIPAFIVSAALTAWMKRPRKRVETVADEFT